MDHVFRYLTRRSLLALGGSVALPAVAACARHAGAPGEPAPTVQQTRPASITLWAPVVGAYAEWHRERVETFIQRNPQIKVTIEPPESEDKLQVAVVSKAPPDIVQSNYIPMFKWASQGALEPIDAYLGPDGKADLHDWARDGSTYQGKLYQWPWMLNPTGLVVNASLFDERNARHLLPKPGIGADWTIEQFRQALRAVTYSDASGEVYGIAILAGSTGGDYWQIMYLWGHGAELYSPDESQVVICSLEGIQGMQFLADLVHRDRVVAPGADKMTYDDNLKLFLSKRVAMIGGSPNTIGAVARGFKDGSITPPFEALFFPPPHAPGKKPAAFVAIQGHLVFKVDDPARRDAAMALGKFLTGPESQKTITPIGELPVRKSVGNIYPDDINRTTALGIIVNNYARSMGRFPENGEIRKLWQAAAQAVFRNEKSPKEALEQMCRDAVPIMANRTK